MADCSQLILSLNLTELNHKRNFSDDSSQRKIKRICRKDHLQFPLITCWLSITIPWGLLVSMTSLVEHSDAKITHFLTARTLSRSKESLFLAGKKNLVSKIAVFRHEMFSPVSFWTLIFVIKCFFPVSFWTSIFVTIPVNSCHFLSFPVISCHFLSISVISCDFLSIPAQTYLQPHYGNGVFGNVYLSAGQH